MTQEHFIILAPYIAAFIASIIGLIIGKSLFNPWLKARKLSVNNYFNYSAFSLMHRHEKIKLLAASPILFVSIISTPISAQMIYQTNALYVYKIASEREIQKLKLQHQLNTEENKHSHATSSVNQGYTLTINQEKYYLKVGESKDGLFLEAIKNGFATIRFKGERFIRAINKPVYIPMFKARQKTSKSTLNIL